MMRKMLFVNPTFHKGINCTVRKGMRWASLKPGEQIRLVKNLTSTRGKTATVYQLLVSRFDDLTAESISLEHAPHCQGNKQALFDDMCDIYSGDFNWDSVITVVYFNVT